MLKYIVSVTEDLLLLAVFTGFIFAGMSHDWKARGVRATAAICALSWAGAIVFAFLKKETKLIDSGLWNLRFISFYLIGLIFFLLLSIRPLREKLGINGERIRVLGLFFMLASATLYFAPEPLTYPSVILTSVKSAISSDFFFRMVGWLVGLALMALLALAIYKVLMSLKVKHTHTMVFASAILVGALLAGLALRAMLTRRLIPQNHTIFRIAVFASNNGLLFAGILGVLALVSVGILVARSTTVEEPYSNPAEHRKIRAKWRNRKRWAAVAALCLVFSTLNVTAIKAYESREVELSPSEEFELRDDGCYIPLTQVDDGHLHRFTYESKDGVGIRFIIIKKPGGSSYGIGLDACDICGETGYYERDDQVVCKLCDVVMNIQTIGFKGGCNPIVIDYSIHDGYIIVPFDTLLEHEEIFTR